MGRQALLVYGCLTLKLSRSLCRSAGRGLGGWPTDAFPDLPPVMELADMEASKASGRMAVQVQILSGGLPGWGLLPWQGVGFIPGLPGWVL